MFECQRTFDADGHCILDIKKNYTSSGNYVKIVNTAVFDDFGNTVAESVYSDGKLVSQRLNEYYYKEGEKSLTKSILNVDDSKYIETHEYIDFGENGYLDIQTNRRNDDITGVMLGHHDKLNAVITNTSYSSNGERCVSKYVHDKEDPEKYLSHSSSEAYSDGSTVVEETVIEYKYDEVEE